jgi:ABC-type tungstate transport system permease subunit
MNVAATIVTKKLEKNVNTQDELELYKYLIQAKPQETFEDLNMKSNQLFLLATAENPEDIDTFF